MTYHTLFLPLAFETTAPVGTDAALMIASAFGSHVCAHHVRQRYPAYPPIAFYPTGGLSTSLVMDGHDEASAALARLLKTVFEERCDRAGARIVPPSEALKSAGVTASWSETSGQPGLDYGLAARVSDLVIMAAPDPAGVSLERDTFETVLIQSGAPVLMVPAKGMHAVPCRPLLAWDGSLQAANVVRGALPLLAAAERTTVLTMGGTDPGTPGPEAVLQWLERSGVKATVCHMDRPEGALSDHILERTAATGSDLIVMGGYSHSRLREALFGGVTLAMLQQARQAVLMMH